MRREFPLVVRKTGEKFVPVFPVKLEAGDQFLLVRELCGSQVPKGKRWEVNGYSDSGPIISEQ